MDTLAPLLALLLGLALGSLVTWWVLRRTGATAGLADAATLERLRAAEASARADAERARGDNAQAEVRVREAQTDAERTRREIAEARADAARAGERAAQAQAEVAGLQARVEAAAAERDAAIARAQELAADRDALTKEFRLLSAQALDEQGKRADATAEQRFKATEQLLSPMREGLERFNQRLTEVERARVAMSTELAEQVKSVQFTGEQLRRETNALATALRKPQVRGAWGELQLKRVAEITGMLEYCDFVQQETASTSEDRVIRPDMKVDLSEGKFVYVDAKVPLAAFLDASETTDERDRTRHLQQFAKNVRAHVEALGSKNYWKADPGTPEFVVMFIPNEALGFEALQLIPDLHEFANARNVVVATPTTLIALLRSVAYGWKQAKLAASAAEVSQLGRELYDRLGTMGSNVNKLGRALSSAVNAYNSSVASLEGRVMVTARRFRDLKVTDAELADLTVVEAPLRQIAAPELVRDAAAVPVVLGRDAAAVPVVLGRDALPEAGSLQRAQPGLDELVADTTPPSAPTRGTIAG